MTKIQEILFKNQDLKYKEFISNLTPTCPKDYFIGIRVPFIRSLVKELTKEEKEEFLNQLPHKYYEEQLLHGFIIQQIKDFDECIKRVEEFLPFLDNWATCDTMTPKVFYKHIDELYAYVKKWIKVNKTYYQRFSIIMLMNVFLKDNFKIEQFDLVKSINSEEYYVRIAQAWYFAECLAKQYDIAIKLIESKTLEKRIHNKSIQKARESSKISQEVKDYLITLRID